MHQSTKRHIPKILSLQCLICYTHREEVIKYYRHTQDSSQYIQHRNLTLVQNMHRISPVLYVVTFIHGQFHLSPITLYR